MFPLNTSGSFRWLHPGTIKLPSDLIKGDSEVSETTPSPRLCPCQSGLRYKRCCRPLHQGAPAPSPEALMRSRYSAYALGLVDYIIDTTLPAGPHWQADRSAWASELQS